MDRVPSNPREGSGGKLAAVLDHTLRLGDADTQEKVIAAHKARGLTPPDHLVDPPRIEARFFIYWEAFQDLQTERVNPRTTIPVSKIVAYADRYGIDPDTLKRIVWKTDQILLNHWKGIDDAEKAQAKAQQQNKPGLAGGGRS